MGIQFFLLVAAGGAMGSVLRALFSCLLVSFAPWPTLLVNLIGAFFLGLFVRMNQASCETDFFRAFWIIGLCGGFTTFSTFGIEVVEFIRQSEWILGLIYLLCSVFGTIAAIYSGFRFFSFLNT